MSLTVDNQVLTVTCFAEEVTGCVVFLPQPLIGPLDAGTATAEVE